MGKKKKTNLSRSFASHVSDATCPVVAGPYIPLQCATVQNNVPAVEYRLLPPKKVILSRLLATNDAPKTIGEVVDHVERLREELLTLQRALEKMERAKTAGAKK